MIQKKLELTEALKESRFMPYAMIRTLSTVYIGTYKNEEELLEEWEDARFFDEKKEICFFRKDEKLQAVRKEEEENDSVIIHICEIGNPEFGRRIKIAWQLSTDEDGQTYISGERLSGWEGE